MAIATAAYAVIVIGFIACLAFSIWKAKRACDAFSSECGEEDA